MNVQSFKGTDCNTAHSLVVPKVGARWAVHKQALENFDVERFNLRKLNELEVRKQYQIKISKRSAALENFNDSKNINGA
jgi:hypothetical protein